MFIVGPGVSAPELQPASPLVIDDENCKKKLNGKAVLSFLVDTTGFPRNIAFEEGAGGGLDEIAYKMVSSDRFKPALHQNSPVIVPMKDEVELQACLTKKKNGPADAQSVAALSAQPKQKLMAMTLSEEQLEFSSFPTSSRGPAEPFTKTNETKNSVLAPAPLNSVEAVFSDEARRKSISGVCLVSLVVDSDGMPRNVRVIRPLGYGLDLKAVDAARKYRFKPAMRKGTPIPVMITVEVNFRLY
jgi:TonB family protein